MPYVYRTYGCSVCNQEFELFQHSDEGPPERCELCGDIADAPRIALPRNLSIGGSNVSKAVDMTYRGIEERSIAQAAESGIPAQKVTNMRDNLREGDVAAIPPEPSKEYKEFVKQSGAGFGMGGGGGGDTLSTSQIVSMAGALRGTDTAAPVIKGLTSDPTAPHRRLTGAFQRPR